MLTADTITDEQIRELRRTVSDEPAASGPDRCSWASCPLRGKHPRMDCLSGHYCTEHALRIEREQIASGQASSFPSLASAYLDEELFETCCVALYDLHSVGATERREKARARCAEILNQRAAKEGAIQHERAMTMARVHSDYGQITDLDCWRHPAWSAFCDLTEGRIYDHQSLNVAWAFFKAGWTSIKNRSSK